MKTNMLYTIQISHIYLFNNSTVNSFDIYLIHFVTYKNKNGCKKNIFIHIH